MTIPSSSSKGSSHGRLGLSTMLHFPTPSKLAGDTRYGQTEDARGAERWPRGAQGRVLAQHTKNTKALDVAPNIAKQYKTDNHTKTTGKG